MSDLLGRHLRIERRRPGGRRLAMLVSAGAAVVSATVGFATVHSGDAHAASLVSFTLGARPATAAASRAPAAVQAPAGARPAARGERRLAVPSAPAPSRPVAVAASPHPAPKPAAVPAARPAPAPAPAIRRPAAPAGHVGGAVAVSAPSGDSCGAALAYLQSHSAPGFQFECPGYAQGHQAMTCIDMAGVCPGVKLIVIAVVCPASYMNEAHNSWVLSGLQSGSIDPYGYCH